MGKHMRVMTSVEAKTSQQVLPDPHKDVRSDIEVDKKWLLRVLEIAQDIS